MVDAVRREFPRVRFIHVETYEKERFPIAPPDPVDAIRFRMDQAGLSQRDLVPYLGSKSKASEVLSGKRPLTLSMIRALHDGLGIPSDVLLQRIPDAEPDYEAESPDWSRMPVKEMARRRWLDATERQALLRGLPGGEGSARLLQKLDGLDECDLYDVLAQEGYGVAPKTRQERADALTIPREVTQLRNNRLALLSNLHQMMNQVADISKLAA